MAKTISNLLAEVDANITSNSNNEITGPVLNGVLKSIAANTGNYFLFPKDPGVGTGDIGKLMMNDGSATAKVYELSPATTAQTGRWVIHFASLSDVNASSKIEIKSLTGNYTIERNTWRNGNVPTTVEDELNLIKDYFDDTAALANLATTVVDDDLIIEEVTYNRTVLKLRSLPVITGSYIDTHSRPALPESATAFPLGKLIGIDGDNAIISSNAVETYTLDGSFTVNHSIFNLDTDIDLISEDDTLNTLQPLLIVPAGAGKVKGFDATELSFDDSFFTNHRQQFVGVALFATTNTVTVVNANMPSLLMGVGFKIQAKVMAAK